MKSPKESYKSTSRSYREIAIDGDTLWCRAGSFVDCVLRLAIVKGDACERNSSHLFHTG